MSEVNRLAQVLPPMADLPVRPKPERPLVRCSTCGREVGVLVIARLAIPHRPPGPWKEKDPLCPDDAYYDRVVDAWRAAGRA